MKKLVLFFCLVAVHAFGQERNADTTGIGRVVPRYAIRFSPFHLINFYPTVQAGFEFRIRERFTLYVEGGYIVDVNSYETDDFQDMRGFKAKLEPRLYLTTNRKGTFTTYLAGEFYYNHVNFDRSRELTECFDLDCQNLFTRRYNYKVRYREPGFGIKYGFVVYMRDFFFDISSGFAIRFITYDEPSLSGQPIWAEDEIVDWFDIPNERSRTGFMPLLGIRMGYRIR